MCLGVGRDWCARGGKESVADIDRRQTLVCLKESEVHVAMFVGANSHQDVHCSITSAGPSLNDTLTQQKEDVSHTHPPGAYAWLPSEDGEGQELHVPATFVVSGLRDQTLAVSLAYFLDNFNVVIDEKYYQTWRVEENMANVDNGILILSKGLTGTEKIEVKLCVDGTLVDGAIKLLVENLLKSWLRSQVVELITERSKKLSKNSSKIVCMPLADIFQDLIVNKESDKHTETENLFELIERVAVFGLLVRNTGEISCHGEMIFQTLLETIQTRLDEEIKRDVLNERPERRMIQKVKTLARLIFPFMITGISKLGADEMTTLGEFPDNMEKLLQRSDILTGDSDKDNVLGDAAAIEDPKGMPPISSETVVLFAATKIKMVMVIATALQIAQNVANSCNNPGDFIKALQSHSTFANTVLQQYNTKSQQSRGIPVWDCVDYKILLVDFLHEVIFYIYMMMIAIRHVVVFSQGESSDIQYIDKVTNSRFEGVDQTNVDPELLQKQKQEFFIQSAFTEICESRKWMDDFVDHFNSDEVSAFVWSEVLNGPIHTNLFYNDVFMAKFFPRRLPDTDRHHAASHVDTAHFVLNHIQSEVMQGDMLSVSTVPDTENGDTKRARF